MEYLPKPELKKMLAAIYTAARVNSEGYKIHHLVALTCAFTGARISQALALRGIDIFEFDGRACIRLRAKKGGEDSIHALHVENDPAFDMTPLLALAQVKRCSKLFGGLDRHYFNKKLKGFAVLAGLPEDYAHSHVFRHSAAMAIMDATQRIGAVSGFLGHKSPSSAFVYLRENDGRFAQEAMDNLKLAEAQ